MKERDTIIEEWAEADSFGTRTHLGDPAWDRLWLARSNRDPDPLGTIQAPMRHRLWRLQALEKGCGMRWIVRRAMYNAPMLAKRHLAILATTVLLSLFVIACSSNADNAATSSQVSVTIKATLAAPTSTPSPEDPGDADGEGSSRPSASTSIVVWGALKSFGSEREIIDLLGTLDSNIVGAVTVVNVSSAPSGQTDPVIPRIFSRGPRVGDGFEWTQIIDPSSADGDENGEASVLIVLPSAAADANKLAKMSALDSYSVLTGSRRPFRVTIIGQGDNPAFSTLERLAEISEAVLTLPVGNGDASFVKEAVRLLIDSEANQDLNGLVPGSGEHSVSEPHGLYDLKNLDVVASSFEELFADAAHDPGVSGKGVLEALWQSSLLSPVHSRTLHGLPGQVDLCALLAHLSSGALGDGQLPSVNRASENLRKLVVSRAEPLYARDLCPTVELAGPTSDADTIGFRFRSGIDAIQSAIVEEAGGWPFVAIAAEALPATGGRLSPWQQLQIRSVGVSELWSYFGQGESVLVRPLLTVAEIASESSDHIDAPAGASWTDGRNDVDLAFSVERFSIGGIDEAVPVTAITTFRKPGLRLVPVIVKPARAEPGADCWLEYSIADGQYLGIGGGGLCATVLNGVPENTAVEIQGLRLMPDGRIEARATTTLEPSALPMTVLESTPVAPGNYFVGGRVIDVLGRPSDAEVAITISEESAASLYERHVDVRSGLSYALPSQWRSSAEVDAAAIMISDAGRARMTIHTVEDGHLQSSGTLQRRTLDAFGAVDLLYEESGAILGRPALRTVYGYQSESGPRIGVLLTFADDTTGYIVDFDGSKEDSDDLLLAATWWQASAMDLKSAADVGEDTRTIPPAAMILDLPSTDYSYRKMENGWRRYASADGASFIAVIPSDEAEDIYGIGAAELVGSASEGVRAYEELGEGRILLGDRIWTYVHFHYLDGGHLTEGTILREEGINSRWLAWYEAPAGESMQAIRGAMLSSLATLDGEK